MNFDMNEDGYLVSGRVFNESEICKVESELAVIDRAGERTMLDYKWCQGLAQSLQDRLSTSIQGLADLSPVQCTYFSKNQSKNWLVAWHQDRSLPLMVGQKYDGPVRTKGGKRYYQPNEQELSKVVAIRLSIDDNNAMNGGLRLLPRTHRHGILSEDDILRMDTDDGVHIPDVERGAALVMSPLLLHSSSKAKSDKQRRVLHFTFHKKSGYDDVT